MELQRILVAFDGSPTAEEALKAAIMLGSGRNTAIHTVHVRKRYGETRSIPSGESGDADPSGEILDRLREEEAVAVCRRIEEIAAEAGVRVTIHQRAGDPRHEILACARRLAPDLIVVGSRGHGSFDRVLLGSVSSYIVEYSPFSTLVIR
jgi:nucleotide-binding universal stress UspA family protein